MAFITPSEISGARGRESKKLSLKSPVPKVSNTEFENGQPYQPGDGEF